MTNKIVDRSEWLKARAELLEKEKAFTRARAELATSRRGLPWVKVEKDYRFQTSDGEMGLLDLFLDGKVL